MLPQCLTSCRINRSSGHSGPYLSNRSLLSLQYSLIYVTRIVGWTPHVHGARSVRTITGEYNTEVADHESAARDPDLGGATMHNRRALAGSDDRRERHALRPGTPRLVFHGSGDFHFFHAGSNLLAGDLEEGGAHLYGGTDAADLFSVLDHAGPLDQGRRRNEFPLALQDCRELFALADGHRVRLEPEPLRRPAARGGQEFCGG